MYLSAHIHAFWRSYRKYAVVLFGAVMCAGWGAGSDPAPLPPWDGTSWSNPPESNPLGVTHATYHSRIMRVDIGYNIYLPPQYFSNENARFPAVYFLHGIDSNENSGTFIAAQLQNMISANTVAPMIMVFPNGGLNSKYMDAQNNSAMAYPWYMVQKSIVSELIPFIDAKYRTIADSGSRAVQGYSMGGMGCQLLMFKFPQMFSSAYCFAPANHHSGRDILAREPKFALNMFNNDANLFQANTVWAISTNNASIINGHPIHVTVGSLDGLLASNKTMDDHLTSNGIAHDALQIVRGCGHDLVCLEDAVSYANFTFATTHFH
jgi:enterochelin esterase-like enzyme